MSATTKAVPAVEADDPAGVVEALEVAAALWEKGDRADAIRWVRRAAEAAADAGNTARLAALARGAADLCAVDRVSAADLEEWLVPVQADKPSEPRPASAPVAVPRRPTAPPPVPTAPRYSAPPVMPSRPPRAPSKAPVAPSVAPSVRPQKTEPIATPQAFSVKAPAPPPQEPPVAAPPVEPSHAAESAETRLRVSVRASVRDPGLLVVRPLAAGEAPPPGTREGVLVMPEALTDPGRAKGHLA